MSNISFLALDSETRKLMDSFSNIHPDGGAYAFKLLLKFYVKFSKWHKKKGRNPIAAFEDLIEKEIFGKSELSDVDRIKQLNALIERHEEMPSVSENNLSSELSDIKDLILSMNMARPVVNRAPVTGTEPIMSLDDFKPTDGATLTKVGEAKPKKRKSYRDVRKKGTVKKISF